MVCSLEPLSRLICKGYFCLYTDISGGTDLHTCFLEQGERGEVNGYSYIIMSSSRVVQ